MRRHFFLLGIFFALAFNAAWGQKMVYQPVNPSFGGNYYNGSWLLSEAQAQNNHKEATEKYDPFDQDPLDDFKESLNRQILSRLSRDIVDSVFGEEGLAQEGEYEIGDYKLNVQQGLSGLEISIIDNGTGNETLIEIPYY